MYGQLVVYFIATLCLKLSHSADETLDSNHNIECQPLLAVVPVKGDGLPHFVQLHRCQGSIPHFKPNTKSCTVKTSTEVNVKVINDRPQNTVVLKNHTSCKEQCTHACNSSLMVQQKSDCVCKCQLTQAPSGQECKENYGWDSAKCECACSLRELEDRHAKELDKENCQYVCKPKKCHGDRVVDPDTCRCRKQIAALTNDEGSDDTHQGKVLAALVIGEFVFLYLIFDFLLYSKKTGLMYYVRCKCRGKPAEPAQAQPETKRCLENGDELNLTEVMVDRKGNSHVASEASQLVTST